MSDRSTKLQDEIELIEILKVIWKWKFLILVGTATFALVAGVISSNRPNVYRISMVLKPGLVRIDRFGRRIYLDSTANMKALLEAGTLSNEIRTYLKTLKVKNRPGSVKFRIVAPKKSNLLTISYETQHVDTGVLILSHIPDLLQKEYAKSINHFEMEYEDKIQSKKEELADIENKKRITQSNIILFEKRLEELILSIQNVNNNTSRLSQEKERYNADNNKNSVNIDLLYSNAIQQNLQLMNTYKNQFAHELANKESAKLELKRIEERIAFVSKEIADLKKEKGSTEYIKVLQPPTSSLKPIKPKKKVAVMLAVVVGLFVTMFISFFLEYLHKHRIKKHD
jgi:capsular polysaccharide biosynthesis protein